MAQHKGEGLKVGFDGSLRLEFHGSKVTMIFGRLGIILIISSFLSLNNFSSLQADGNALNIYIVASQENMDSGFFKVEFRENFQASDTKTVTLPYSPIQQDLYITPYISDSLGSINFRERIINYSFRSLGDIYYGYVVKPLKKPGTGFCNKDIGIMDLMTTLPSQYIKYPITRYDIIFEIPLDMRVYAPFVKKQGSEREFIEAKNLYTAAWGHFTYVDSLVFGDHKFYMLGYNLKSTNVFKIMKFSYEYFFEAVEEFVEIWAPNNVVVILPEEYPQESRSEGPGGYYCQNRDGSEWNPDTIFYSYDIGYLNIAKNINGLTVNGVHTLAHTILHLPYARWEAEGVAVFYQIEILYKMGIISEQVREREFLEHLRFYQDEIVAKGKDISFQNTNDFFTIYLKSALVFYSIDRIIKESTNGQKELIDFLENYYSSFYGQGGEMLLSRKQRRQIFLHELAEITGKNFQDFFDKYVYNVEPLPLKIQDNNIIVTWDVGMPKISLDTEILSFSRVFVDSTYYKSFTIHNTGYGPLNITSISAKYDTILSFTPDSVNIDSGQSQEIIVAFTPDKARNYADTISIFNNDSLVYLMITGDAFDFGPKIILDTEILSFGRVFVDSTYYKSFTIHNTGYGPLNITSISAKNDTILSFTPDSVNIDSGQSQEIIVAFTPDKARNYADTISIFNNDSLASLMVTGKAIYATVDVRLCDVNKDGRINISDLIRFILWGRDEPNHWLMDWNDDGVYSTSDAIALLLDIRNGTCSDEQTTLLSSSSKNSSGSRISYSSEDIQYIEKVVQLLNLTSEEEAVLRLDLNGNTCNAELPKAFSLNQNHSNPFNPTTTISYTIFRGSPVQVTLKIYDIRGQLVRTLVADTKDSGSYNVFWDGRNDTGHYMSSGVYLYRMRAEDFVQTRKMVLLK